MIDWHEIILNNLNASVQDNSYWKNYLKPFSDNKNYPFSIHLGVFVEPFLQYILDGKKTIETRFSAVRCAPYERAEQGDIILLKKSGGPIIGLCQIKSVSSYRLEKDAWKQIKTFAKQICAEDPSFWEDRKRASYATLMHIDNVAKIPPLEITKRDRRGWVVLHEATRQKEMFA